MTKRQRFIITAILLSLSFMGIQLLENSLKFPAIGILGVATAILFYWSLKEGLGFNPTLLTLVLPTFFTLGVGIFWFLLPASLFARLPVIILYGLGIYVLCLTANIYTVAAIRTIALLRAARGVGFVLTLLTSFLVYDAILSVREGFLITFVAASVFSFPLFLQSLWTASFETFLSRKLLTTSLVFSLIIGETGGSLYFWPVTVVVGSLFLTVAVYILLGLGQAELEERLFVQTVREYLVIGTLVFIGMFFATRWG